MPRTILTVTEAQRLLDGPDTRTAMGIRDRAILEVFYSCGIRVGEMAGLSLDDVDWRHGFLRVTQGKSASDRVVPIGATAAACVRDYICRVRPMWSRDGRSGPALWLSSREPHRPITAQTVQVIVRRYARTAGVGRPVTPHVWRHTCATHFLNAGANLIAVQHLLGHRSLTTTQIYTRVSVSEMQQTHRRAHPRAKVRP